MKSKYISKSGKETQKIGKELARDMVKIKNNKKAIIICLNGALGSGKTTFLQGFAKGLGVKEKILSPTFVILKKFRLSDSGPRRKAYSFLRGKYFYHIDCYRLKSEKDLVDLGFKEIISNPKNIIAIEWPEIVKKILPKNSIWIYFSFVDENTRQMLVEK